MIWVYRIIFLPALLFLGPRYLLRMRRRGGYRKGFKNRFGVIERPPAKRPGMKRIWLQAVSVGEIFAVTPIIRRLHESGRYEIFLTTTTSTGYQLARENLSSRTIGVAYFPLDFWLFSRRAWNTIQPDISLLFEAEIWPEHLHQAKQRGVPLVLINARMSDRTYRRLSRVSLVVESLLNSFARILAASKEDAERFISIGADDERVAVAGNIKLDVNIEPILSERQREELLQRLGLTGKKGAKPLIIVGSSTWPGEERILLRLLKRARSEGIECKLLIVPRHMERREEIGKVLEEFSFPSHFRSAGQAPHPVDVAIGDSTGELIIFTQIADIVFVGKSLSPNDGGQTPIEAAAMSKPLIYGPYMTNFRTIARELVDCGGALVVGDEVDLIENAVPLLKNPAMRARMGEAARKWHIANRGAVDKAIAAIDAAVKKR